MVDLNTPTDLFLQWGWLLITRANGIVYVLILAVFVLGVLVRLPGARRDLNAVDTPTSTTPPESGDGS